MNCKNCNTETNAKFCSECGYPTRLKRIDGHYIIHEIEHILHFERGILYTIRELITNPGQNIRNYLSEDRNRLVKPILFIIITSLIYSFAVHLFHFEDGYVNYSNKDETTANTIFQWVSGHYGYANILMGVFIALWLKVFFRKHQYNIFEILILLCFVMGMGMLLLAVFGAVEGLTHVKVLQFGAIISIAYITWSIGNFFGKRKIGNYIKALIAYLLGLATFTVAILLAGSLIDLITKQ